MAGITQEALDKLGVIAVSVARIEERQINQNETIIDLVKKVNGNGKPGLLDRVSVIESAHLAEKENKAKWDSRSWAIVMLIIGQIITIVFLFAKAKLIL